MAKPHKVLVHLIRPVLEEIGKRRRPLRCGLVCGLYGPSLTCIAILVI
jgi:hypothetical protein